MEEDADVEDLAEDEELAEVRARRSAPEGQSQDNPSYSAGQLAMQDVVAVWSVPVL